MTRLVIANRGEIARRILRTARERGLEVAVISTVLDAGARVRREVDAVLEVSSFLSIQEIVVAARAWGADLLHPGYGFLSENAEFGAAVEDSGMAFVGPRPDSMRLLGSKEAAKALARRCGVPVLESVTARELADLEPGAWAGFLRDRGLEAPYLVKASGGGGGRGMRRVTDPADLPGALLRASSEASAAFGDGSVFVERYLVAPRHLEVQVFGDGKGGGVFLGERECSLQRRHQKVLEEAPSGAVDGPLREALGRAALALVRESRYRGAGTVEFLLDPEGRFHFLEVNVRLQVEHPVTEAVLGIDLVAAQLDLAAGTWPAFLWDPTEFHVPDTAGVALEARILAEDTRQDFVPTPGPLRIYREPEGPWIRVDSGVAEGDQVNGSFDPLLAKLIVRGRDRFEALSRLREALRRYIILGTTTNLPFLLALSRHPDLLAGRHSTDWIGEHLQELNAPQVDPALLEALGSRTTRAWLDEALGSPRPPTGPLARLAGLSDPAMRSGGRIPLRPLQASEPGRFLLDPGTDLWVAHLPNGGLHVALMGEVARLDDPASEARSGGDGILRAPLAGVVLEVRVGEGEVVREGQILFVLESMKMQMEIRAPLAGRVAGLLVRPGQVLAGTEVLATLMGTRQEPLGTR
jgi:acetyl/propionyl-CoA carboxylase alpha subunit